MTPKGPDQASIYDEFESDNVLTLYTHALIIFEGAREGAGGLSCDTEIWKYLDFHLDYDGQSSLIM